MVHAFESVTATQEKYKTNPRIAAYILALDRVTEAMHYRGFYA
jgi:glutamate dehydrogenase (NAD(P)+)